MPLPLPRLDNRTFDQLVEEGLALLPRYAPGWTDHNAHDPGITLIELLAWLVEQDVYRLDRTAAAAYRTFLRLVGIEQRPPQVAETVLVFTAKAGRDAVTLPQGVQVASQDDRLRFQTTRKLLVLPTPITTVLCGPEAALSDCSAQNQPDHKRFAPFGADPQPGHALYLGFDQALPAAGRRVSLYVWVQGKEAERSIRQKLSEEWRAQAVHWQPCCPRSAHVYPAGWQHYSARTVWEYYAKDDTDDKSKKWQPLTHVLDETRALTMSGAIRFSLPTAPAHTPCAMSNKGGQYFIRCRLVSGYYECPPEIQHIALNAVPARQSVAVKREQRAQPSDGRAGQLFQLQQPPVTPGSTCVYVAVNGTVAEWREGPDWDRVGPHDCTYVVALETGQITFGNGLHGQVPPAGATIAATYQQGGGALGNVAARTLRQCGVENVCVAQPFPASGGADAETLADAKGRAIAWLKQPQRTITLEDCEQLALATPGVPVARAWALPDYDPALPALPALGSVTVVVAPGCANPIPEPGPAMLRAIAQYLNCRRPLTTELHVISPSFVTVGVRATLHGGAATVASNLLAQASTTLDKFLDPLHGGANGQGWPLGRDVYQSEIMGLLNAIPGVEYVDEVGLLVESGLAVYQGYVTWQQTFARAGATTTLHAQVRIEAQCVASRVTAQARSELERYFQSPRGRSAHLSQAAREGDVTLLLRTIPGVLSVEAVQLDDEPGAGALCGNVPVCAHSLIVPGKHQITVLGARGSQPVRASQKPCEPSGLLNQPIQRRL